MIALTNVECQVTTFIKLKLNIFSDIKKTNLQHCNEVGPQFLDMYYEHCYLHFMLSLMVVKNPGKLLALYSYTLAFYNYPVTVLYTIESGY